MSIITLLGWQEMEMLRNIIQNKKEPWTNAKRRQGHVRMFFIEIRAVRHDLTIQRLQEQSIDDLSDRSSPFPGFLVHMGDRWLKRIPH